MQWTLNLTSHWHVRLHSLRLYPGFEGCCFSWLVYRLQTCLTAQALLENEFAACSWGFLAPRFPSSKRWSVVKKGWKLNGLVLSISRIYLTFASFHDTFKTMQLTSSIGARKTCVESTQPKDVPTRKQRCDKPCKPSSRPGLHLEDIQANLLLTSKETAQQCTMQRTRICYTFHIAPLISTWASCSTATRLAKKRVERVLSFSHNEAMTCCLLKTQIRNEEASPALPWESCHVAQKRLWLRALNEEVK